MKLHEPIHEHADSEKNNSPGGKHAKVIQDNRQQLVVQKMQAESFSENKTEPVLQKKSNNTGLPDNLKSGIENLSGHSMDDVKVHYNSDKPAQLNAHAYAQGTDIHVASGQEKHLAHEAWHVVQQKQGRVKPTAQLKGKVNVNDDAGLEKEADVMGQQALLKGDVSTSVQRKMVYTSAPFSGKITQRVSLEELAERGARIQNMAKYLPTTGINLWRIAGPDEKVVYLLGTGHGLALSQMGTDRLARQYLIGFLQKEHFTTVLTEVRANLPGMLFKPDLEDMLEEKIEAQKVFDATEKSETASRRDKLIAKGKLTNAESRMGGFDMKLDDAYLALATTRAVRDSQARASWLENDDTRSAAHAQNVKDMHLEEGDPEHRLSSPADAPETSYDEVITGNQRKLALDAASEMLAGRDRANPEERNKQWMEHLKNSDFIRAGDRQLWIIGAAHIPGLLLRFMDLKWKPQHMAPPRIAVASSSQKKISDPVILVSGLTYAGSRSDLLSAVAEIAEDRGAEDSSEALSDIVNKGLPFKSKADLIQSLMTVLRQDQKKVAEAIADYIIENSK